MKLGTQHYLVHINVFKWLEMKTIVICFKFRAKLRFSGFLSFFDTYSLKVVQTWLKWHKTCHTTLFGIFYIIEMVTIENNSHKLEITC